MKETDNLILNKINSIFQEYNCYLKEKGCTLDLESLYNNFSYNNSKKDNLKNKKKAKTGYQNFFALHRQQISKDNPTFKFGEISKEISKKWGNLTKEEKKKFESIDTDKNYESLSLSTLSINEEFDDCKQSKCSLSSTKEIDNSLTNKSTNKGEKKILTLINDKKNKNSTNNLEDFFIDASEDEDDVRSFTFKEKDSDESSVENESDLDIIFETDYIDEHNDDDDDDDDDDEIEDDDDCDVIDFEYED